MANLPHFVFKEKIKEKDAAAAELAAIDLLVSAARLNQAMLLVCFLFYFHTAWLIVMWNWSL
jgi:hypothetical protein